MSNRATSQTKLYKQCEQFVLNAYRSLEEEPQKLKAFITLFHRAKKPDAKILESQMKLVNIIQDIPDLVRQLNLLVPEEFKVPELDLEDSGQQEGDDQIDINAIFTELHKKRPEKVKELITLLQNLKNKQSSLSVQALRESVYKILEEEPKLLNAFMRCVEPLLNESAAGAEEEHEQDKPAKGELKPGRKRPNILMPTIPRGPNARDRRRDPEGAQPSKDTPADSTWPSTLKYEMYLFEYLEKNLSEEAYSELAKIIFLYTECIISAVEVFQMAKPLFEGNDNYFNFFQEIIHIREPMRRKNTILFKPLNEVDFKSKKVL
jgi:histone deacetylase complex regulatory component SIN3